VAVACGSDAKLLFNGLNGDAGNASAIKSAIDEAIASSDVTDSEVDNNVRNTIVEALVVP